MVGNELAVGLAVKNFLDCYYVSLEEVVKFLGKDIGKNMVEVMDY